MVEYEGKDDPLVKDVVRESIKIWKRDESADDLESRTVVKDYSRYVRFKWLFIAVCIIATIIVIGFALTIGDYKIGFFDTYRIVFEHITGNVTNPLEDSIIFTLRLPRLAVGVIAGAGLAIAGVVMQSTLMNPLADPYTTGVSSGASFGATAAMVLGVTVMNLGQYGLVLNAFIFSLVPMFIIVGVSRLRNSSPTTMIMAGIAVMYIFNAFTTVITLMADPNQLQDLYRWTVGSLGFANSEDVPVMFAFFLVCAVILQLLTPKLNLLATGDENAKSMGVNADKIRRICLILVAVLTASVVSFTGLIGFVGLVAPHIVRLFVGADNRFLLPASAAFGALLLVLADVIGRTVIAPAILQVGVITAFLGGPLFLWLIVRKKSNIWG